MFKKKIFLRITSALIAALFVLSILSFLDLKQFFNNQSNFELTIYHTNDTHAHIKNEAVLASLIKQKKTDGENVITISAGDAIAGHPVSVDSKGKNIVDIFNDVGYDYLTPGNHEFDFGLKNLKKLISEANFKFLSANIKDKDNNYLFEPYDLVEINGIKIGIFGLTTVDTPIKTNLSNGDSPKNLLFLDPIDVSKEMIRELKSKNADIIIAVSHLGLDIDPNYRKKFVSETKNIDLIIDAHSHTNLSNGIEIDNTLIVQTGEHGENIGEVNLKLKKNKIIKKAKVIKTEKIKINPEENVLKKMDQTTVKNSNHEKLVCKIDFQLIGTRKDVRTHDTNLTNLITDIILKKSQADLVLLNAGNFRENINAGEVYESNIKDALPYSDDIVVIKVKGSEISKALENGISHYPKPDGSFAHIAGAKTYFDPEKENKEKILKIVFNKTNENIDPEKYYSLATSYFLANKGDNYDINYDDKNVLTIGNLKDIVINFLNLHANDKSIMNNYKRCKERIIDVKKIDQN